MEKQRAKYFLKEEEPAKDDNNDKSKGAESEKDNETFKKVTSNIDKINLDAADKGTTTNKDIKGGEDQESDEEVVDISINTFSNKLRYISTYFIEKGFTQLKSYIDDAIGFVKFSSENKITDKDEAILKELAKNLNIDIEIEKNKSKDSIDTNYEIRVKNNLTYDDYMLIYDIIESEKQKTEDENLAMKGVQL